MTIQKIYPSRYRPPRLNDVVYLGTYAEHPHVWDLWYDPTFIEFIINDGDYNVKIYSHFTGSELPENPFLVALSRAAKHPVLSKLNNISYWWRLWKGHNFSSQSTHRHGDIMFGDI